MIGNRDIHHEVVRALKENHNRRRWPCYIGRSRGMGISACPGEVCYREDGYLKQAGKLQNLRLIVKNLSLRYKVTLRNKQEILISQIFKFFNIVYHNMAAFNFYKFFRFKITQGPDKRFGCCADVLGDFLP
jgi:hypothetical protein